MVFPKSTVHVSRLAGTALKSFTHGYAQTVVAASQSSYASQNTPVAPLASNFLGRFKDKPKSTQHVHFGTSAAGQQIVESSAAKHDVPQENGLGYYQDAWQKHHKAESREWNNLPLAKRIGWKPPTTIPEPQRTGLEDVAADAESALIATEAEPTRLKRSYSTSAVDNFAKAIQNEEVEARAIDQVNQSIAGEVSRSRNDLLPGKTGPEATTPSNEPSQQEVYTAELDSLVKSQQYDQIPAVFESMLRHGVAKPSQRAYRALLKSAIELTQDGHLRVPRVLDIYSDMMRRRVVPDKETISVIVDTLAERALDAATISTSLAAKNARYGPLWSSFSLDQLEHKMMSEDQALEIAFRLIATSPVDMVLSSSAFCTLIQACAIRGQTTDMLKLYNASRKAKVLVTSDIYPTMLKALGEAGDLRAAVSVFDHYRGLAIANNSGSVEISRIDAEVYSTLIAAYGACNNIDGGKRLLAKVDAEEQAAALKKTSRETILTTAILPLEVKHGNFADVYDIVNSLSSRSYPAALSAIVQTAAAQDNLSESAKAFDALVQIDADLHTPAATMLAMHIRLKDVEAGERYWRVLENGPVTQEIVELSVLRALSYIRLGQTARGIRPVRNVVASYLKESANSPALAREASERVEEAIEVLAGAFVAAGPGPFSAEAAAELLRMMEDQDIFIAPFAGDVLSALSAEQISNMGPGDLDVFCHTQARLLVDGVKHDVAAPARFTCILENIMARSILPEVKTENAIEKVLVSLARPDLNQMWSSYRYPSAAPSSPVNTSIQSTFSSLSPPSTNTPLSVYEDTFDPYLTSTDHKGSVVITDILEKTHGRPHVVLNEAMTKFRNIRRAGRHPRFFVYGKLIQAAAKSNQLDTAQEVLAMAKQDVPYLPQYRVVNHGWVAILDAMVAACITTGRRDMAGMYHQDLLDMGAAPSANTFGLYITSLKETTKTFDEASEAVKIYLRSKAEGVEPTSFLYNALIGKLGKARRIDDCLFYFAEMRSSGIKPTSVTYGTIVNALCRVSDEKFAEEIFEEMEACTNYKPRPAPYHSLMQFFLTTKRDRSKVLSYYERMRARQIEPTMHTFKLLIDAHATIEPLDMMAAENVLSEMRTAGLSPEAVHHASLIHARGCVQHDADGARAHFDKVLADKTVRPEPCVYQALFESLVAARKVAECEPLLADMRTRNVPLTAYIVNALIHGWTQEGNLDKAVEAFALLNVGRREPSTYEAMVRAHLAVEDRVGAEGVIREALGRGYPGAVASKIAELVGGGRV